MIDNLGGLVDSLKFPSSPLTHYFHANIELHQRPRDAPKLWPAQKILIPLISPSLGIESIPYQIMLIC